MKAVVFHGVGDIRLDDVREPKIEAPTDAIVRLTAMAICGTDLHLVRGTMPGVEPGTVLGHEGVGVVEEVGKQVRGLRVGDRVVVCSTISCGYCVYCRAGHTAQCDHANPNGPGTAFFGGPKEAGGFHGLQAERARIPHASNTLVRLPEDVTDDQAIVISDILPTAYFAAELAGVRDGDTVAVLGCGPVGQLAIACAMSMGAGRVFAVDQIPSRLEEARGRGAEVVDFSDENAVEMLKELTGGIGPDRVIDAVGVDAESAETDRERAAREGKRARDGGHAWEPGDAPDAALETAVAAVAKAGTIAIVGVYPPTARSFPIGAAMNKNLKVHMGNCNHRRYVPRLVDLVRTGHFMPADLLSQLEPMQNAIAAYEAFDSRRSGWHKVELVVA